MSLNCPTCNRTCDETEEFCLRCHTQLFVGAASAPPLPDPEDEPLGIGMKVFLWLLLFAAGACAGLMTTR